MKQLLAISWTMPPVLMPRAFQVSLTLKCLAALGWQTTVLSASPDSLRKGVPRDPDFEAEAEDFYRVVGVKSEQPLPLMALERYFFLEQLAWLLRARRRGRDLLKAGDFKAIISFAQPWAGHLVGLRLHRLSGLPWAAHFSDPWVDSPYLRATPWQRRLWEKLEAAVIREAQAVIFVNSQTAAAVMRKYPGTWRDKVHIIPHGYDPEALKDPDPAPAPRQRLRMVFTGRFYRGRRTPEGLFRALQTLQQVRNLDQELEVRLLGPYVDSYQDLAETMGLGRIVTCSGPVPFAQSQREAAAADVLLVIDAPSNGPSLFLPSKLVDYLAFRKPILGLTPAAGPSADLLRQLECPVVAPDNPEAIARAVAHMLDFRQAGHPAVSPAFAEVAQEYDIRQTTRQLDRVLEGLIRQ